VTKREAADILDPKTSRVALLPWLGDEEGRFAAVEEACTIAAKELRNAAEAEEKQKTGRKN
jgi:hypothetical protein